MKPEDLFQFVVVGVVITMVLGVVVLLFCKDEYDDEEGKRKHERWRAEREDRKQARLKQKEESDAADSATQPTD